MAGEELFGNTGILLSLLIIMGLCVADVVLIILLYLGYSKCKKMLLQAGVYDTGIFIVRLLTPFCVSFLLVVFFINSDRLIMAGGERGGSARYFSRSCSTSYRACCPCGSC